MCLKIDDNFITRESAKKFSKKPLIAKSNIYVYKFFIRDENEDIDGKEEEDEYKKCFWYSPYRGVPYFPGAIHQDKKFSFEVKKIAGRWRVGVNKGIHAFLNKEIAKSNFKASDKFFNALVRCKIPKGTPYFKNGREIASLALEVPEYYWTPINGNKKHLQISKGWELHF